MNQCRNCKVTITNPRTFCPLCQNELVMLNNEYDGNYPVLTPSTKGANLFLKTLAFFSIIASIISIFINIVTFTDSWWSLSIIITLLCAWTSCAIAIYKHKKILKYLLYQSIIITFFSITLDFMIGWHGWSITFVVPIIFTIAMIAMYALSKALKLHTGDYIIYLILDALFGIIPIIFLFTNMIERPLPSLICIITSITSITALIIFEGSHMNNELKRRLHI